MRSPCLPEQRAIVRYLDHVDRRIRRYVSAKRKLIALLEEEKQAVVNRAVTRGLDPNVRLKPSGVEWLGDVPEHWEMRRLRVLLAIQVRQAEFHTFGGGNDRLLDRWDPVHPSVDKTSSVVPRCYYEG